MAKVLSRVERTHGHGHGAYAHRPEEGDRESAAVIECEQHALLASHAEPVQQVAHAVYLAPQLFIGEHGARGQIRWPFAKTRLDVTVDQEADVALSLATRIARRGTHDHTPDRRRQPSPR